MIRRPAGDEFLLIRQDDHARLAGELARHLGNDRFAAPAPTEPALAGISMHDAGWPLHDDQPTLNANGQPLHVFELPMTLAVKIWNESARRAAEADLYGGLLASLHQLGLSEFAKHTDATPHERQQGPRDLFELNKFQHRQAELQEELRGKLGFRTDIPLHFGLAKPGASEADDRLRFNFRWLVAMDRISLQLCCGKRLFPEIEEVYPQVSANPLKLKLREVNTETLIVDPWPFGPDAVHVEIAARSVTAQSFPSEEAFRRAYQDAPRETVRFELRHP
jgi:hypothetical protein